MTQNPPCHWEAHSPVKEEDEAPEQMSNWTSVWTLMCPGRITHKKMDAVQKPQGVLAGFSFLPNLSLSNPTGKTVCDAVVLCCAKSLQLYLTLCDPMDCSPPGSSVHGILQARILEWVAMPSSRGSSWLRNQTHIPWIGRQVLYH